jgi:hypothetical protein
MARVGVSAITIFFRRQDLGLLPLSHHSHRHVIPPGLIRYCSPMLEVQVRHRRQMTCPLFARKFEITRPGVKVADHGCYTDGPPPERV